MSAQSGKAPDEAALQRDLQSAAFLVGEAEGRWQLLDPPGVRFPHVFVEVSAAVRESGPPGFCFRIDCAGYPSAPPTTMLWDQGSQRQLAPELFPKGGGDVAKVFRTDWPPEAKGSCLYHPMDRRPLSDHAHWSTTYASQAWHARRTIVNLLEMIYGLLNSPNYRGI